MKISSWQHCYYLMVPNFAIVNRIRDWQQWNHVGRLGKFGWSGRKNKVRIC